MKYETIELNLDEDVVAFVDEKARELNMTLNEFVNLILENHISEKITASEYCELLKDYEEKPTEDFWNKFWIIIDDFGKPIAKIRPYKE
jgi:hypothetical protein